MSISTYFKVVSYHQKQVTVFSILNITEYPLDRSLLGKQ